MTAPAKPVVWITRPQPGADRTAAAVAALGFEPVVLPLTEVVAVDPEIDIDDAQRADFVAVTSANAVRLAPAPLLDALRTKPVYTVGDATKAEAEAHGFSTVFSAGGAVDDLAALVASHQKPGSSFVYLCGRRRTGNIEEKLRAGGIDCLLAEVYRTNIVSHTTKLIDDALTGRRPDAILFHSALSARAFAGHAASASPQAYERTMFFVMSGRVADALPDFAKDRMAVASAPAEPALLETLASRLRPAGA